MRAAFIPAGLALLALSAEPARAQTAEHEDIYVFRTHQTGRIAGATPACAVVGFETRYQDTYAFHAVETDAGSGLITDAEAAPAPGFTACIGVIDQTGGFDMAVTGRVANTDYEGVMRCQIDGANTPAPGLAILACRGALTGLGAAWAGGYVTSSTQAPMGDGGDIPGYVSTSIVTYRLWRAR